VDVSWVCTTRGVAWDLVATFVRVTMNAARLTPVTDRTMISTASSLASDGRRTCLDVTKTCAAMKPLGKTT
jgi:hypothetical protein